MPGKPRRTEIFEKILARNPVLQLTVGPITPPNMTLEQRMAFFGALVCGLLKRFQRKNVKEGQTLKRSIQRLERTFWLESTFDFDCAIEQVIEELTSSSTTQLAQRLQPSALQLAKQADTLLKHIPSKAKPKDRERWVIKYGLEPEDAVETDAALIEHILHLIHGMSESAIHKRLAQASCLFR